MKDKVIVITGGSAGIGAALAAEVGRRGARTVLVARRKDALDAACAAAGESLAVVGDVTRRADHDAVVRAALDRFGRIDVWVNNAGRGISRPVTQVTEADIDEMMRVNLKSAMYGVQAVLPHFEERGTGQIINVSSMLGRVPFAPIRAAYAVAKAALNMYTAHLRLELRASHPGIAVTLVLPGVVATDFGKNALHGGPDNRQLPGAQPVEEVARVIADVIETPRGEVYTRPQMRETAANYYGAEDIDQIEGGPMFQARR